MAVAIWLSSKITARSFASRNAPDGRILGRRGGPQLDHGVQQTSGGGVPTAEERRPGRVVGEEQSAQVRRQRRTGWECPGERLGHRRGGLAAGEHLGEVLTAELGEDRVAGLGRVGVHGDPKAFLAPKVVQHQAWRYPCSSGDRAHRHRIVPTLGQQAKLGVTDIRPGGEVPFVGG